MDTISATAQMLIRAAPQLVFDAFVNAETMSRFWFTRRDNGLAEGETIFWYVGASDDAYGIEVRVRELRRPETIRIEWGDGNQFTEVVWRIERTGAGFSRLTIEENGFMGSNAEIVAQALDSTKGFNQLIVALKALLEHDAPINIVADHSADE